MRGIGLPSAMFVNTVRTGELLIPVIVGIDSPKEITFVRNILDFSAKQASYIKSGHIEDGSKANST